MAQTVHIEMFDAEEWRDVANSFMQYCFEVKNVRNCGCHEVDPIPIAGGKRFAGISIPDHSPDLVGHLLEWAVSECRDILRE